MPELGGYRNDAPVCAALLPFAAFHHIARRFARCFLEYFREEVTRSRRAADVQAVHAVLHETQITLPAEIAEHKAQAFEFRRWQSGVVDIEYVTGTVRQGFRPAAPARVVFRFHERSDHQRPERSLRPHLFIQAPRLE